MGRLAWREVRYHPVRFGMSILAVVLGVAFVTATLAMRSMLGATFDQLVQTTMSGDVYVHADTGKTPDLAMGGADTGQVPDAVAATLNALPEVEFARAEYQGPVVLVGSNGDPVTPPMGAPSEGFVWDQVTIDKRGSTLEGSLPHGPDQVVLESKTALRGDLKVGDATKLVINGQVRDVTVTGVLTQGDTAMAGAVLVMLDSDSAKAAFAPAGLVGTITVYGTDGLSQAQLKAAVTKALPAGVAASTANDVKATSKASIDEQLGFMSTFMLIFAVIALFVGAFLIANTFSMVVRQRLRETAVLRAIGASPKQVFGQFVGQAAIIGLVGGGIGLGGGFGLLALIRKGFDAMGMSLSGAVPVTVMGTVGPVVLGVVVACASAAWPARKASQVAPVQAMHEGLTSKDKPPLVRNVAGLAVVLIAVVALAVAVSQGDDGATWLGAGAAAGLLAALLLAPGLTRPVTWVLSWPLAKLFRPFGTMAGRGLTRNVRRTANTAAALLIGTALVSATMVMAASAKASIQDIVKQELKADFMISDLSYGPLPAGYLDQIRQVDGARVMELSMLPGRVEGVDQAGSVSQLGVSSKGVFTDAVSVEITQGDVSNYDGAVVLGKDYAAKHGLELGDRLSLVLAPDTPFQVTVEAPVAVVIDSTAMSLDVELSDQLVEASLDPDALKQLMATVQVAVSLEPSGSLEAVRQQLVDAAKPFYTVTVMDQAEFNGSIAGQVDQMMNIIYALLALSVVIAVLGIVNTLALSVIERTREIGLMRAVGLGRGQLSLVMVFEGVLIALFGAVLGLALGSGLAALLPQVFGSLGLSILVFPWVTLGGLLLVAAVVGVLAAVWPAIRAARLPVLQAVSYE